MVWRYGLWFTLSLCKPTLVVLLLLLFASLEDPIFRSDGLIGR